MLESDNLAHIYITGSRVYNPVKVFLTLSTDSLSGRNLKNEMLRSA